jgi:hypothetical protein
MTLKKKILSGLAAVFLLVGMVGLSEATIYNATTDFSINNANPNGIWSYGWMPTDFSTFNLYTASSRMVDSSPQWYRSGSSNYTPVIWRLDDSISRYGVAVGQLSLHPGSGGEASALRWTAPSNGQYHIDGQFFSGHSGIMQVGVRQGADWLWQGVDAGIFSFNRSVTAGTSIDFVVYGGYVSGNTPLELTVSDNLFISAPPSPTGVVVTLGNGKAAISWGNTHEAASYNIYWSTVAGVTKTNGTKIANVTSPYIHEGLTNGVTYYYVVAAVNAYGESGASSQVSAKPDLTYIPPPPPTMITPIAGDRQNVISWTAVTGATAYNLYWSTEPGVTKATGIKIANVKSPYTHTGLVNFTSYYYMLVSVNAYGEGNSSSVFSVTPKGAPSVPANIKVTEGDGKATITWDNVNGATGYNIYWSTTSGVTKTNGQQILNVTNPFIPENLTNLTSYYYIVGGGFWLERLVFPII